METLLSLAALASRVGARRAGLRDGMWAGFAQGLAALGPARRACDPPLALECALPPGMEDALCVAGELAASDAARAALDAHYTRSMPGLLARQLFSRGGADERLFSARLSLSRLPRVREALESLWALVAGAGLPCRETLGAATPQALFAARPTLAHLYAGAHFGRSMPMLYAYPGDLLPAAWAGRTPEEYVDARFAGPLAHELAHLLPLDPALVPAPGNLHEALAAWIGSEAFPAQLWPAPPDPGAADEPARRGGEDALPGGAFYASVGGWVARAIGPRNALRAQAGALDLESVEEGLGPACAQALRLRGWLPYLESGAPHLLADTFRVDRWWKLIDLHRDPALAARFDEEQVRPLFAARPPPGPGLVARLDAWLDALEWPDLPAWREAPDAASGAAAQDRALLARACRALAVRTVRTGASFRAQRTALPPWPEAPRGPRVLGEGPLRLEVRRGLLRSAHPGPDAVGALPEHPVPPSLCAAWARAGFDEVRGDAQGLPRPPSPVC